MRLIIHLIMVLLAAQSKSETVEIEDAQVKWINTTGPSSEQDNHPSLPDNVVLTLTIDNETVTLNLMKNQRDNFEDVPVIIGGDNNNVTVWHHKKDEELSSYNDMLKDASFSLVRKKENGITIAEYSGSFVHKGIKYSLTPINYHEMSNKASDVIHEFTLNGITYVVFIDKVDKFQKPVDDVVEEPETNSAYVSPEPTTPSDMVEVTVEQLNVTEAKPPAVSLRPEKECEVNCENNSTETPRSPRRKRNWLPDLHVDLMVVIDYSMYNRWLKMNNYDKNKAIESMRYYLAHVLNGVNNVFATMASPKLFVTVVEIFIAGTTQQSWYFENPQTKDRFDDRKANFEQALTDFQKWVIHHKTKKEEMPSMEKFIPEHDIAVVFTDYNESPTEGLAYSGTVCGDLAQGIIHEKGQYDTITTAAHEIAHVLGSLHDGQDNKCNPDDHYLMSPVMTNAKIENRNTLSYCTMRQIVDKAVQLHQKIQNCMDSSKKSRKRINLEKLLNYIPGSKFSADEQCQLMFGSDYKFCSEGQNTPMTICNQMRCLNTKTNTCHGGYPTALNGTTCGNGKWCINGQCVNGGPQKPSGKDTCFFGDKSDKFGFNGVSMTCKDIKGQPSSCYNQDIRKWCCQTCEEVKKDQSNCIYGDQSNAITFNGVLMTCKDIKRQPSSCYTPGIQNWCCQTCEEVKKEKNTGLESCPYGDIGMQITMDGQIHGCKVVFQRYDACDTPNINKYCCESCNKVSKTAPRRPDVPRTGPTNGRSDECKDNTNFLVNNKPFKCETLVYNSVDCYELDRYCCKSCRMAKARINTGLESCPYGDIGMQINVAGQMHGCEVVFQRYDACDTPNINKHCCESCNKVRRTAPRRPDVPRTSPTNGRSDDCKDSTNFLVNNKPFKCETLVYNSVDCYELDRYCCKSCRMAKARINIPLDYCLYGNKKITSRKGVWQYGCEYLRQEPNLCFDNNYENICCGTCYNIKRSMTANHRG